MKNHSLLLLFAAFILLSTASCKKNELTVTPAPSPTQETKMVSELSLVSFYNMAPGVDAEGNNGYVVQDSSSLALIDLAGGNVLALHSFYGNGSSPAVTIEGEYIYDGDGWIREVYDPATALTVITTEKNGNNRKLVDHRNDFEANFPEPQDSKVPYYTSEVKRDTLDTAQPNRKKVVVTSDSVEYRYNGQELSSFDVYEFVSDSFQVILGDENTGGIRRKTEAEYWNHFLDGKQQQPRRRTGLKNGAALMQSVSFAPADKQPQNPLFGILAPLNFRVMEVPFVHSKFLPGSATIKDANQPAVIKRYEYEIDEKGRTTEMREYELNAGNQKELKRIITFRY